MTRLSAATTGVNRDIRENRPLRLLVVMPSWVGDAVMATPALRVLRELLPATFIGGLVKPGIEQVLAGTSFFDTIHVGERVGLTAPARIAAALRLRRYDTALLLTNSFSSAFITRLAGISKRLGYRRDARGFLLSHTLDPPRRREIAPFRARSNKPHAWAPIPARDYYFQLISRLLRSAGIDPGPLGPLELVCTADEEIAAAELLERAGIPREHQRRTPMALLNPGGNNPAKRWPPDRFAALADYLARHHALRILINGSPGEARLAADLARLCQPAAHELGPPIALPEHGITLGRLKGVIKRSRLVITNDTGPRHIAAAFGTPVVTLFGPTDHRWTEIAFHDEIILTADPTLPEHEVANDHPERCRIDRIGLGDVVAASNKLLERAGLVG